MTSLPKWLLKGKKIADFAARLARVEHVLMFCGDGLLKDDSKCSQEFRAVLKKLDVGKLQEYLESCSGQEDVQRDRILFDVIHDLGRRIGFRVTYGSYESQDASIGSWQAGDLSLSVKMAFSASALQEAALAAATKDAQTPVLLVVSQDQPLLAAQIRGSRNSWNTRLVGCQALVRLAENIKDESGDFARISRGLLAPVEYTQVDSLLDISVQLGGPAGGKTRKVGKAGTARSKVAVKKSQSPSSSAPGKTQKDPKKSRKRSDLIAKRVPIVYGLGVYKGLKFEKKVRSGSSYVSEDGGSRACVGVSRRYGAAKAFYLFSLTQTQVDYISGAFRGYYVAGCLDKEYAYAIPAEVVREHLTNHKSSLVGGLLTWQVKIYEDGEDMVWYASLGGERRSLGQYVYPLSHPTPA